MKIHKYKDYNEYRQKQIDANVRKLDRIWVDKNSLTKVIEYLHKDLKIIPSFILCHGTRKGDEQQYFLDYFANENINVDVLGTEISHTAKDFPNTIEWDFHEVKDEWLRNTDIIYSNSFDHSIKPKECLDTWMSCLKKDGVCVIEYSTHTDHKSCETDPFGATYDEYVDMIQSEYEIVKVIHNKGMKDSAHAILEGKRYYFIIKNKEVK